MEPILGLINGKPSKARALVLRNNGIKRRYYALKNGLKTHTNAQMAAIAIRALFDEKISLETLELIATGTSSPEQILPSHASMVQGELGGHNVEIMSASGSCCSSVMALKYAWLSVGSSSASTAAVCGSELFSAWMLANRFQPEADSWTDIDNNPYIAFEKDFLRWMLSDGAAAALVQDQPAPTGISLRIDWLETTSYANELETCMYSGAVKDAATGKLTGWNEMEPQQWMVDSVFAIKQDTRLLGANIIARGGDFLRKLVDKYQLTPDTVDYYLPHMSSEYFRKEMETHMKAANLDLPAEKWFYNLSWVGNVGSASPFLMLEELFYSGRLNKGDRVLVMVPESARFTYAYCHLTVV